MTARLAASLALPAAAIVLVAGVLAGQAESARLARINQEAFVAFRGANQQEIHP